MLDFIKLRIDNQELINRVFLHPDFVKCIPKNNYYYSKYQYQKEIQKKLQLDFHKINDFNEFDYVDVCISPHYHFNNYLHNGNDLTPENCIKSIFEILDYLQIKSYELNELKVVNLEVGVNIIPKTDVKELINGIYYSKKTPIKVYEHPYNRRTEEKDSEYKIIKTYAKGLQFQDQPQLGIDINTFRFEVKTKKHRKIKSLGITTAKDLLNIAKYPRLAEEVINEWQNVLLINLKPDLTTLRREDVQFIKQSVKLDFWNDLITKKHRNTVRNNKNKYYNILKGKNNLHHLIKLQIIDKIYQLLNCANSPQETPINKGILKTKETALNTINGKMHN